MFRLTRNLLQWKLITDVDKNKKYGYMATLNFFHIVNLHHINIFKILKHISQTFQQTSDLIYEHVTYRKIKATLWMKMLNM
jgi:hypothetical protein